MLVNFLLTVGHHLAVFALVAVLIAELVLLREAAGGAALARLGRLDMAYGLLALAVLVVGIARVFFGLRGADYYLANPFFWTKLGAFLLVGLLSIRPTLRILAWRRAARSGGAPSPAEIAGIRGLVWAQLAILATIPVSAAALAVGYGA